MKRNQSNLLSDGAFLLWIVMTFVSIIFIAGDPNRYILNIILLNVALLVAIITYFTSLTIGLILNVLFIFGYGTFTLYQTLMQGSALEGHHYFWLIMTPVFTIVAWMITFSNQKMQAENEQLLKRNQSLATMDENTDLKNSRSFQKDATIFMALSKRYQIELTLLVVKVRYWDELKQMVSREQMTELIYDLSKLSETSIRMNDSLYMLNSDDPTWGLLLFTDREGASIVINRIKDKVAAFNAVESTGKYKIDLDLIIGAIEYEAETVSTPLDFIAQARKQLEYDV
ncbi:diguanylate cyclase domain-containing protein [Paenibacillus arenosi]|uniref:GGDEF domain-containing protein n=1 Tax=Paenibacillus arenosi TaxID=2774142 RepID=A0ABR9AYS2_9BACL|nr:diguanylate cyclase [Paenibacillus arenosi]MBD8499299.1 GGDEF domain-containing protein [Paenibacillus arenosi]